MDYRKNRTMKILYKFANKGLGPDGSIIEANVPSVNFHWNIAMAKRTSLIIKIPIRIPCAPPAISLSGRFANEIIIARN